MAGGVYSVYKRHIRGLLTEYGRLGLLAGSIPVQFLPSRGVPPEDGGVIRATDPSLRFSDGSILRVQEEVQVVDGEIELLRYSYHYERPGGYFFRYERENPADPVRKPEYHMHAVLDLPHFVSPPVNLETILELIKINFYSQDTYSRQIIGQHVQITV